MQIPYEVSPRRDTGLFNSKLGVWLFLASEVMLFGGLFSAYVFLRVGIRDGVDTPWPWGIDVHGKYVFAGFINTLVLILSSVWVVFAWVALKERNWRKFQLYMFGVVGCAAFFMCVKALEYNSKLTKHHGIKLTDNAVLEGKIVNGTSMLDFEATEVSVNLLGGIPAIIRDLDSDAVFTVEWKGGTVELKGPGQVRSWFLRARREARRGLVKERKRYRNELKSDPATAQPVSVTTSATLVAAEPVAIRPGGRIMASYSDTSVSYRDGTTVTGTLQRDGIEFELHQINMQLVMLQSQRDSMAWEVIGDESVKDQFFAEQDKAYKKLRKHYGEKPVPEHMLRSHIINLHDVHLGDHGDHDGKKDHDDSHAGLEVHDSTVREAAGGGGGKGETIVIPREKVRFFGSHGPRYGNYYAIYFTITALHGLHVVGGAIVLLYFAVFGRKLFLKNPEHLANRVEVGGLFWHFVDLIWIFLFPLFYLL